MNSTTPRRKLAIGDQFEKWTVVGPAIHDGRRFRWVPCRCACGTEARVSIFDLRRNRSKSCGCLQYADVQVGAAFNDWTVVSPVEIRPSARGRTRYVECRCVCGTIRELKVKDLVKERRKNCGCKYYPHGASAGGKVTSEYRIWSLMRDRCNNPNNKQFADYGGRGIRVCERWARSFPNFLADVGPRPSLNHTLDRKDNDRGYEPSNVRWATRIEQNNNRRSNRILELNGRKATLAEWARELGLTQTALRSRLKSGWSIEAALGVPTEAFRHPLSGRITNPHL